MSARERLTCEAMFRMQADHADGPLSEAVEALVLAHLQECARCASEAAFERSLDSVLRQKLAAMAAPPGLLDRIRTRLRVVSTQDN